MKRFSFLSVVIALVLMVSAVSCTTMQGMEDEYYQTQRVQGSANRIYVEDPYRGTIVLERDPYSGRYYEASPYGSYGYGNNRYDSRYDRRYQSNGRNNRYNGNRNYGNNGGGYRPAPPQQQSQEQIRENEKNKADARKKILGN